MDNKELLVILSNLDALIKGVLMLTAPTVDMNEEQIEQLKYSTYMLAKMNKDLLDKVTEEVVESEYIN